MSFELSSAEAQVPVDLVIAHADEVLTCRPAVPGQGVRGAALDRPERIADGALAIDGGTIVAVGHTADLLARFAGRRVIDARGRLVTPGFVDTHTHLVHAGYRHEEWGRAVRGLPIRPLSDGIASTVSSTTAASVDQLRHSATARLDTMLGHGTTTAEVKSGYGLVAAQERRLLEVARTLDHEVELVSTFLGAHVLPSGADRDHYIDQVIGQLGELRPLAEYVDLCCDPVGFTADECVKVATAAVEHGYQLRIHADQTGPFAGAELAVDLGAASADHLEFVSDRAIGMLAGSTTAATLLPGVTHHVMDLVPTRGSHGWRDPKHPRLAERYRRLIAAGALVVLASDYNPGTCPTLSMQTVMQLAARLYQFSYAEAWHMSTINAATSIGRDHTIGSLEAGKQADVVVWAVPSHEMVIHQFGVNLADMVIKAGVVAIDNSGRTR